MASVRKGQKMVLVMVGLPARGKSFTARRLARYLSWLGYPTRVFNLGEQRRTELGGRQTHEFFDPSNEEGRRIRQALAQQVLEELVLWLRANGRVAIYDATNHTRARRQAIRERCETEGFAVQFSDNRLTAGYFEAAISAITWSGTSAASSLTNSHSPRSMKPSISFVVSERV